MVHLIELVIIRRGGKGGFMYLNLLLHVPIQGGKGKHHLSYFKKTIEICNSSLSVSVV